MMTLVSLLGYLNLSVLTNNSLDHPGYMCPCFHNRELFWTFSVEVSNEHQRFFCLVIEIVVVFVQGFSQDARIFAANSAIFCCYVELSIALCLCTFSLSLFHL